MREKFIGSNYFGTGSRESDSDRGAGIFHYSADQKSNELIDQVCAAINIELEGGQNKDSSAVPIEEIAVYNITDNFTVNLARQRRWKEALRCIFCRTFRQQDKRVLCHLRGDEMTELTDKETIIRSDINTVVAKYTEEEFNADGQKAVKEEILSRCRICSAPTISWA